MSPLVGLAKKPLWVNVLFATSLPKTSKLQRLEPNTTSIVPPWQWATGGGVPKSGNGASTTPHEPLLTMRLRVTMSWRAPVSDRPTPNGVLDVMPAAGTVGLLLSCR